MIESLVNRFDSLTDREKIICITTLLVLVWWAWDHFFYQPVKAQQNQLTTELSSVNTQLAVQQQAAIEIKALGEINPNLLNMQKLQKVKTELKKLKQQLDTGNKKFVPAHDMTKVLANILKKNKGLKLIQLETLPVSTLSKSEQKQSWVYRHGLSLTLSGNYFSTLNYLKSLETLPWRLNWGAIEYQVKEYPIAETTLHVYTLSYEKNWLGL